VLCGEKLRSEILEKFVLVAVGGSLGALSRYGITLFSVRIFGDKFPAGTLLVNLGGCLLIGLSFALGVERDVMPPSARLFFVTGFLGALTTFSTYGIESVNFFRNGMLDATILNIAANNIGGLCMVLVGLWLGRIT
jgi:CrcB protein